MLMAEQNKIIYRFRCGNTRQNARKNPELFDERSLEIVATILALIKYWVVLLVKKLVYVGTVLYLPWNIMELLVGKGTFVYEPTMSYIYIIMSVLFGSLINPWLFRMTTEEKKFLVILNEKAFFFNRLVMRTASDAITMALALRIFQVGFWQYGLWISIAAALLRPMGEVVAYFIRQKTFLGKRGHNSFMGICMALGFILAYVIPVINKTIGGNVNFFYSLVFAIICIIIFAVFLLLYITEINFRKVRNEIIKEK